MFQFFGCEACGLLAPPEGVLTTVPPGKSHVSAFLFFKFLAAPQGMWDFSPKTRGWTQDPWHWKVES